jgi:hypothetical protein
VDGIVAIRLTDRSVDAVAEVAVSDNFFIVAQPPESVTGFSAVDAGGRIVYAEALTAP